MSPRKERPAGDLAGLNRWITAWADESSVPAGRLRRRIGVMVLVGMLDSFRSEDGLHRFLLKGATALELRLPEEARVSRDVDLVYRDVLDDVHSVLSAAVDAGWDGFSGRVLDPEELLRPNTPTGTMRVATPEVTLLDLINWQYDSGGISNVGSIARGLVENDNLDTQRMADAARSYPASISARAGWIIEEVAPGDLDLSELNAIAGNRNEAVLLSPKSPTRGDIDHRWNVRVNSSFEPES
jgi:AbiEi antitoxin C-terminal domain/Nucleotidyl transferase AbiEii toxin, Type IV TA system